MPATYTPIRYPGGKTKLYPVVSQIIHDNFDNRCTYIEPFAGGAGLAIKLLVLNDVEKIIINDIDRAVYSMLDCIVNRSEELIAFIESTEISVNEWRRQREIYRDASERELEELGFAAFYLNRTNRSGILSGGLIGGESQNGDYDMSARFNINNLVKKIRVIARLRDRITVLNMDAFKMLDLAIFQNDQSFAYFDPPYVQKGPGLYANSFDDDDHRRLGKMITKCSCRWIVTYDPCSLVEEIYTGLPCQKVTVNYSAHQVKNGQEYLISGKNTKLFGGATTTIL
ncbi:MAG: DNA adenine methylase [Coriobacteriia bacterium]|nr:DNA adenine methylase [Coriobacteriia bacterium]